MIEHKFLDLKQFKKPEEAAKELDRLMQYEGFVVLCCCGKINNTLLLRRILQYEEEPQPKPQPKPKQKKQVPQPMFPNAVYQQ